MLGKGLDTNEARTWEGERKEEGDEEELIDGRDMWI